MTKIKTSKIYKIAENIYDGKVSGAGTTLKRRNTNNFRNSLIEIDSEPCTENKKSIFKEIITFIDIIEVESNYHRPYNYISK